MVLSGRKISLTKKESTEKSSAMLIRGVSIFLYEIPPERMASNSESEDILPKAIEAPDNVANGKVKANIIGTEYIIMRSKSSIETFFISMFLATRRIWLIKKMKKKKRNEIRKDKRNSLRIYFLIVK